MTTLQGINLVVVGGDRRDQVVVERLAQLGAQVTVVGLPVEAKDRIRIKDELKDALLNTSALILPMPGIDAQGQVYAPLYGKPVILDKNALAGLQTGTPVFTGVARQNLKTMTEKCGLRLIEIANLDEVAILNSVPSAEGAIQIAMEGLPITIHSSRSMVIGFGRSAVTLTRLLLALGSKVRVVARNPVARTRAWEMGAVALPWESLADNLSDIDFVFNTVPTMILDQAKLTYMNRQAMIIDIATSPGGTDFDTAAKLGIQAVLAPGLPGKVAPKTAGEMLASVYPKLIREYVFSGNG